MSENGTYFHFVIILKKNNLTENHLSYITLAYIEASPTLCKLYLSFAINIVEQKFPLFLSAVCFAQRTFK